MILDISQEVFSCRMYGGDPPPTRAQIADMSRGDPCNVTAFTMAAHSGTHADAPFHFLAGGKTIDQMGLEPFVGDCFVVRHEGEVTAKDAEEMMEKARTAGAGERLLIAGRAVVTAEAAQVFATGGLKLLGNESQTVGPEDAPAEVHHILLGANMVLLEGIILADAPEGRSFLSAAPLKLGGCDGAPCRAYLMW